MGQEIRIEDIWNEYRASVKAFLHSRISDPDEIDDLSVRHHQSPAEEY